MKQQHILVVEDEEDIQELSRYALEREGYQVATVDTGEKALRKARRRLPSLIVLDLMLPGMDGLTVCRELRADEQTRAVPILMLTAKGEEIDVVTGLEVGADDYMTKPFSPRVLVARVRAALRRAEKQPTDDEALLERGGIAIDCARHEVRVDNEPVELTHTEFMVLLTLARRPGIVFKRYQIVDAVRGEEYPVTDRSVDVQMVGLRKKLGAYGRCIETVRGVGYRFVEP